MMVAGSVRTLPRVRFLNVDEYCYHLCVCMGKGTLWCFYIFFDISFGINNIPDSRVFFVFYNRAQQLISEVKF